MPLYKLLFTVSLIKAQQAIYNILLQYFAHLEFINPMKFYYISAGRNYELTIQDINKRSLFVCDPPILCIVNTCQNSSYGHEP